MGEKNIIKKIEKLEKELEKLKAELEEEREEKTEKWEEISKSIQKKIAEIKRDFLVIEKNLQEYVKKTIKKLVNKAKIERICICNCTNEVGLILKAEICLKNVEITRENLTVLANIHNAKVRSVEIGKKYAKVVLRPFSRIALVVVSEDDYNVKLLDQDKYKFDRILIDMYF